MPRKKKEVVNSSSKIKRWYNFNKLFRTKADYLVCYGQRANGKTYSVLKKLLEIYRDTGEKFCYLRRWTDDISNVAAGTLFDPLPVEEIFGEGYEVKYRNKIFSLVYNDPINHENDVNEVIGYAIAVSDAKHRKGMNFVGVTRMFFDEFIDMNNERILENEYNKFENIVSTVKRTHYLQIIMVANTVQLYSEYFQKLGINPDKIQQGELKILQHPNGRAKVAVEHCEYIPEIGEEAGYLTNSNMIAKGEWEINEVDNIPSAENEVAKEYMIFSAYLPQIDISLAMYLRHGEYETYETIDYVVTPVKHVREFLVIRRIPNDVKSSYFHLTNQKSLSTTYYQKLDTMLNDILEGLGIDIIRELETNRVFCDTKFTADNFNKVWQTYSVLEIRNCF